MNKEIPPEILDKFDRATDMLRPSREEVLAKHGRQIAAWAKEYELQRQPTFAETLHTLWHGLSVRVVEGMRELAEAMDGPKPAFALARGVKGALPEPAAEKVFIQAGTDCYGRLAIQPDAAGKLRFEVGLRDKQNRPVKPFHLTVRTLDGKTVLDRKPIAGTGYALKLSTPDHLFMLTSADGKRTVRMGLKAATS